MGGPTPSPPLCRPAGHQVSGRLYVNARSRGEPCRTTANYHSWRAGTFEPRFAIDQYTHAPTLDRRCVARYLKRRPVHWVRLSTHTSATSACADALRSRSYIRALFYTPARMNETPNEERNEGSRVTDSLVPRLSTERSHPVAEARGHF